MKKIISRITSNIRRIWRFFSFNPKNPTFMNNKNVSTPSKIQANDIITVHLNFLRILNILIKVIYLYKYKVN